MPTPRCLRRAHCTRRARPSRRARRTAATAAATAAAFAALLGGALPALASEGVVEINQARALAGGVTPTDAPGFPVTLGQPGSYRLTSDLALPPGTATGVDVIEVTVDEVSIDLAGFTLRGVASCTGLGAAVTCAGAGAGRGIDAGIANQISVRGGTVTGMSGIGVVIGSYAHVEDLRVEGNALNGLDLNEACVVRGASAIRNGGNGFDLGGGCSVSNVTAYGNKQVGVASSDGTVIEGSSSVANGSHGYSVQGGSLVSGCVARSNGGFGVNSTTSGYQGSALTFNSGGNANPQASGGFSLGANVCGTDTVCP